MKNSNATPPEAMNLVKILRFQAADVSIRPEHDLMLAAANQIEQYWKMYVSLEHD